MKKAKHYEKELILDILSRSFDTNQSVNYIIKQDKKRKKRIRELMDYSFELCLKFGDVFVTDDKKACVLVLYPHKKKTTLKSILLDVKLIIKCLSISNIKKTLKRESLIKKVQGNQSFCYLWFIGVDPEYQERGIGSKLLSNIIKYSQDKNEPVYLETSTLRNLPWYKKFGFEIYHEEDLGYKLYFLRKPLFK